MTRDMGWRAIGALVTGFSCVGAQLGIGGVSVAFAYFLGAIAGVVLMVNGRRIAVLLRDARDHDGREDRRRSSANRFLAIGHGSYLGHCHEGDQAGRTSRDHLGRSGDDRRCDGAGHATMNWSELPALLVRLLLAIGIVGLIAMTVYHMSGRPVIAETRR